MNNSVDRSTPLPQRSAVLAPPVFGALICLALLVLFGTLASGIGLVSFELERGQFPQASIRWLGAAYGLVALIVSFSLGGFVASRFARPESRSDSVWLGLGSWSVVVVSLAFLIGSFASSVNSFLVEAGVGAGAAAGAAGSVDEITSQLSKVRIVTDMKILKGKAVTQILVPRRGEELAGIAAQEAPREVKSAQRNLAPAPKIKHEVRQVAGSIRSALGKASLALVIVLLIGAASAGWGGLLGRYPRAA